MWDGRAFQVWDATDWSDIQIIGEVAVGAPIQNRVEDRIQTIGSRAYLYDAEPVWLLNPDNTTVAPLKYRMVIDFEDPTAPSVVGPVDFRSMNFASSGNVAVGSLARDGTTILEVIGSGDLVQRFELRISGILTILDDRLYLFDEGAINVVDLTNLQQPEVTRLRADLLEDDAFSQPVFWDHNIAEGDSILPRTKICENLNT